MSLSARGKLRLNFCRKIWDRAVHNALTDLIFFQGKWLCVFRESDRHVHGQDGIIRIIASDDGLEWHSLASFQEAGIDLRDPKLSETPDGRLMLLAGGTRYVDRRYISRQPRVAFSPDGKRWSALTPILEPHEWLWRVTWFQGRAYGVSYRHSDPQDHSAETLVTLFVSSDGLHYDKVTVWDIPGFPSETTLRFFPSGQCVALVRRDLQKDDSAWIGTADYPYRAWDWNSTGCYLGGPNFLILEDESIWMAGRIWQKSPYGLHPMTCVGLMSLQQLMPLVGLPSGGDTSYPGMVYRDGELWLSYYSSHEGNVTAVYLACFSLKS